MRRYWLHLELAVPDDSASADLLRLFSVIESATRDLGIYLERFVEFQAEPRVCDAGDPVGRFLVSLLEARRALENRWGRWIPLPVLIEALQVRLDAKVEMDLVELVTSPSQVLELLSTFEPPEVICQVITELPLTTESCQRPDSLLEVKIRSRGDVWCIHKSDQDNWPSNPHAHNYETHEKLDLRTGEVYYPAQRSHAKPVRRIDRDILKQRFYPAVKSLIPPEWLVD